ncbi:MAG: endoribonuclease YicC domain-containing protein [Flavobacteriales bacterium AspAUS03]
MRLLAAVKKFITNEGGVLQGKLIYRIKNILNCFDQVAPFEMMRKKTIRKNIQNAFNQSALQLDFNRLEEGLIYYLEKWDITEEILRLKNHCDYLLENLQESAFHGKKIRFHYS